MSSAVRRIPYGADVAVRKRQDLERAQKEQAASRGLAASQIGSGGILKVDGSLQVTGSITVPGTLASAGAVTAGTTVTAGTDVNAGGNVVAPNGTLVSVYARNHQVATGYVSAWIDISGNVLATASARKFKRDISDFSRSAWRRIQPVIYRLRSAWILADMEGRDTDTVPFEIGVIADDLLEDYPELVVLDAKGEPWSFHYERLAVVAIDAAQQLAEENDELRGELQALAERVAKLEQS